MGGGNFQYPQKVFQFQNLLSHFTDIDDFQAADLNSDGKIDIVIKAYNDSTGYHIYWIENLDNQGNFGLPQLIKEGDAQFELSDLDNDGNVDILFWNFFRNSISYKRNQDGNGNFGEEITISADALGPEDANVTDMDQDGLPDIISASKLDNTIAWYKNEMLRIDSYLKNSIIIYPNPVSELLEIFTEQEISKIELFTTLGQKVADFKGGSRIDFTHLKTGFYIIKIFNDTGDFQSLKVVKE